MTPPMMRKTTPPPMRPHCNAESPRGKSELPLVLELSSLVVDPELDDPPEFPLDDPPPLEEVDSAFVVPVAVPLVVDSPAEPLFVALESPPPDVLLPEVIPESLDPSVLA